MTILDYIIDNGKDLCADIWDDEYDACVTVDISVEDEAEDNYDKFCRKLLSKVEFVNRMWSWDLDKYEETSLIAQWSRFIRDNLKAFRKFSNEYWVKNNWDDDDDFVYEWIGQLHLYMAGYGTEDEYGNELLMLLDNCK